LSGLLEWGRPCPWRDQKASLDGSLSQWGAYALLNRECRAGPSEESSYEARGKNSPHRHRRVDGTGTGQ
jgi:hypothetical protein